MSVHLFMCCPANWEILIFCQNTNQGLVNLTLTNALEDPPPEDEDGDFYWHAVDDIYNPQVVFTEEEEPLLDLEDYF